MSTPNSNFVAESFSDVTTSPNTGYCERNFACTHALTPHPNQRVVSQPNAFTAYYADTLGADGTAPLHSCGGGGAAIGVVDNATVADLPARPDGGPRRAYQLGARGVDGLVYVCVAPFHSDGIRRVGMRADDSLDFRRVDPFAAGLDEILRASGDRERARRGVLLFAPHGADTMFNGSLRCCSAQVCVCVSVYHCPPRRSRMYMA